MKFEEAIGNGIEEAYDFLNKLCSPRTRERDRKRFTKTFIKELFGEEE